LPSSHTTAVWNLAAASCTGCRPCGRSTLSGRSWCSVEPAAGGQGGGQVEVSTVGMYEDSGRCCCGRRSSAGLPGCHRPHVAFHFGCALAHTRQCTSFGAHSCSSCAAWAAALHSLGRCVGASFAIMHLHHQSMSGSGSPQQAPHRCPAGSWLRCPSCTAPAAQRRPPGLAEA
jgi:hypothetical protein